MNVKIERAAVSDAEEILLLQRLAYQSEAKLYNDYRIEPLVQTLEQLQKQFQDHTILKALAGNAIVGSVRANYLGGTCSIGKLMVDPTYQNQGIGKLLMHAIEGVYPKSRYELFTGSRSERNISFYGKLGYKVFSERAMAPDFSLLFLEKIGL